MNRLKCGNQDPFEARIYREVFYVAVVGIVFLVLSIVVARNPLLLLIKGQETTGVITEVKEEDQFKNGKPIIAVSAAVEYPDTSGAKHKLWLRGDFKVGSTMPVVFLPDEPEIAARAGDRSGFGGPALPFVMGLSILIWALWRTARLLKKRKILAALIARVAPITAKVIHVQQETHTSTSSNRTRTHRTYRLVAQAPVNGNAAQEFESYKYVGWSPVEVGAQVTLYLDPTNPKLYYFKPQ